MPRRTSLDATKWKELENKNSVPSLWELCIENLSSHPTKVDFSKVSLEDRKALAAQIISSKKVTRECLELFSSCDDVASCVSLDLSNSPVTDYGLYLLSGLTHLIRLQLHNCRNITNRGLYYLKYNVNLEQLDISKCKQITDEGLPYLSYLTNLKKLEVNDISGGVGKGLCTGVQRMRSLMYLSVDRSRFDAKYLPFLQNIPNLQTLSFKDCKTIHDDCAVSLTSFPALTEVDVSGNLLSSRGIGILQSLLMGRDDIANIKIRSPVIIQITKRSPSVVPLVTEKQLKRIDTLFSSKQLAKYIASLAISASSSLDISRSLRKLMLREKEQQLSFKESSPIVKQRMMSQLASNEIQTMVAPNSITVDCETESESDSDEVLCVLSSEDSLSLEICSSLEDSLDTADTDSSLDGTHSGHFEFDETDDLPTMQIRIEAMPVTLESQTEIIRLPQHTQSPKKLRKRANSIELPGKENTTRKNKVKQTKQNTKAKAPKTPQMTPSRSSSRSTTQPRTKKPEKKGKRVSLCRQFANITLDAESGSSSRPRRSTTRKSFAGMV